MSSGQLDRGTSFGFWHKRPDPFERQLSANLLRQSVVVCQHRIEKIITAPQANLEELTPGPSDKAALGSSTRNWAMDPLFDGT